MSIKAIFVDFYGTIVYEDGDVVKNITEIICKSGKIILQMLLNFGGMILKKNVSILMVSYLKHKGF